MRRCAEAVAYGVHRHSVGGKSRVDSDSEHHVQLHTHVAPLARPPQHWHSQLGSTPVLGEALTHAATVVGVGTEEMGELALLDGAASVLQVTHNVLDQMLPVFLAHHLAEQLACKYIGCC